MKLTTRTTAPAFSAIISPRRMREIRKNKNNEGHRRPSAIAQVKRSIYHPTNQPHPDPPISNARQLTRSISHKQAFLTPSHPFLPRERASIMLVHTQPTAASTKTNSRIPHVPSLPPSNTDVGWRVFFSFSFSSLSLPYLLITLLEPPPPPPLSSYSNSYSWHVRRPIMKPTTRVF